MERITEQSGTLCRSCSNDYCKTKQALRHREPCKPRILYDRLQAYENLGYTPEELEAILEERK